MSEAPGSVFLRTGSAAVAGTFLVLLPEFCEVEGIRASRSEGHTLRHSGVSRARWRSRVTGRRAGTCFASSVTLKVRKQRPRLPGMHAVCVSRGKGKKRAADWAMTISGINSG